VNKEKFLTIAEAATVLGMSKDTIRRRIKVGEIKAELRPSPYGEQYYINQIELTGAVKNVDVAIIEHTMTPEELICLFKQAMQDVIAPLHSEVAVLKAELIETKTMLSDELKEQAAERDREIVERMCQALNEEALKQKIAALHDSIKKIEEQEEREATHFDLMDKRITDLVVGSRKGFWARLFNK
jgi:excisionase family DNA binding protein